MDIKDLVKQNEEPEENSIHNSAGPGLGLESGVDTQNSVESKTEIDVLNLGS